jgi:hypothetical protein
MVEALLLLSLLSSFVVVVVVIDAERLVACRRVECRKKTARGRGGCRKRGFSV